MVALWSRSGVTLWRERLDRLTSHPPESGSSSLWPPSCGPRAVHASLSAFLASLSESQGKLDSCWFSGLDKLSLSTNDSVSAYEEIVHFKPNLFRAPQGAIGSKFVSIMATLYQCFGERGAGEGAAIKTAMVATQLLLQQPFQCKDHKVHRDRLQHRLALWAEGNVNELMLEARTIQRQFQQKAGKSQQRRDTQDDARHFAAHVHEGKLRSGLRMLSEDQAKGVLSLDDMIEGKSVRDTLKEKHPPAEPLHPEAVLPGDVPQPHNDTYFAALNRDVIRQAALNTQGAAGPSGMDAADWRYICTSFKAASDSLCDALASCARRLATQYIDPISLESFVACRLIPLDKDPGVRPIGIGEVVRRIVSKAILKISKAHIEDAVGCLQLCGGQESGIEAAIHAMRNAFSEDSTEGALFADASNAFNRLNRSVCLQNVQRLCPPLAPALVNTYRSPARLFSNGETILSCEGTTQGDPLAMPMYALGTVPLIREASIAEALQSWYADDSAAASTIKRLRKWWSILLDRGPLYGYFTNATKSVLLVNPQHEAEARKLFSDTEVQIRTDGFRHLGAVLGTEEFCKTYVSTKVQKWSHEISVLSQYALSHPQAAYTAFCNGVKHEWSFVARTIPATGPLFEPIEDAVRLQLIPALTGRCPPGDQTRAVLSLPCRLGGLGLINPTHLEDQFRQSSIINQPLVDKILRQESNNGGVRVAMQLLKSEVRKESTQLANEQMAALLQQLDPDIQYAVNLASEKGASSWLTSKPLAVFGFKLHKGAFRDSLCLQYGWTPDHLPTTCACRKSFTTTHALSCSLGGYPSLRHNEIREITAHLLREVAHDVAVEPHLQPLSGEHFPLRSTITDDNARLDIAVSGLYGGRFERTFLDVRVFNPFAPSNQKSSIPAVYRKHEQEKRRSYERRVVEVEHELFIPVVLSTTGGHGKAPGNLYARIASMLADKRYEPFSIVMAYIRTQLSFALVNAAVTALRGHRHKASRINGCPSITLAVAECSM